MRQPLRDMILKQAANGYTVHEIAQTLGLSDDTVRATIGQTRSRHDTTRQPASRLIQQTLFSDWNGGTQ